MISSSMKDMHDCMTSHNSINVALYSQVIAVVLHSTPVRCRGPVLLSPVTWVEINW